MVIQINKDDNTRCENHDTGSLQLSLKVKCKFVFSVGPLESARCSSFRGHRQGGGGGADEGLPESCQGSTSQPCSQDGGDEEHEVGGKKGGGVQRTTNLVGVEEGEAGDEEVGDDDVGRLPVGLGLHGGEEDDAPDSVEENHAERHEARDQEEAGGLSIET